MFSVEFSSKPIIESLPLPALYWIRAAVPVKLIKSSPPEALIVVEPLPVTIVSLNLEPVIVVKPIHIDVGT